MAQENKEIDFRAWVMRILSNWYWFLLSAVVFGLLGLFCYFSTTYKFTVESEIMLREAESGNSFLQPEMLDMLGMKGEKKVDDEIIALTSRDIISKVISDLGLQQEYRKKKGLRWIGQYPKSDILLVASSEYLEDLVYVVEIDVKVRKNDYVVHVECARKHSRHVVDDLTKPFETCAGTLCFDVLEPEQVVKGARYNIKLYPKSIMVSLCASRIRVVPSKKDSKVIIISSKTDIPGREQDFIRTLVDLYNADAMHDKNMVAQNTAMFIDERLQVLKDELLQAEENLVQYLEKYELVEPELERELFLNEEQEYRRQMSEVETQINMITHLCEFMEDKANEDDLLPAMFMIPTYQSQNQDQPTTSNVGVSGLSLITAVDDYNALIISKMRLDETIAEEKQQIAQIDAELAALRANIMTTIKNVRNTMLIAKQDLENHFALTNQKRNDIPEHVRTYEKMLREKHLKEKLYLLVCEQREENAMLLSSTILPIKVIVQAQVDPIPVSPKYRTILIYLIIGLIFPLGIMIVYDMLNNRVSDNFKDLTERLKISLVGLLVKNNSRSGHIVVCDGENSAAAESFRSLRANLRFMQPAEAKCPVILVTSSANGEGKTYTATNLAVSMALLGKKVALVGLDFRKPMLATYLNLPSRGCLVNYLTDSDCVLDDVIVASSVKNLDVLSANTVPANPSELLQSDRVETLFTELRERYDYVIVDSASVSLVSDTFFLSSVVDMTVYVVRVNHTTFDLVDYINKVYDQQRLPKMVAVLNGVDAKKVRIINCL